jgi:signal transduction histidine kinase/HPt (histidine-containing phosphotransfer) domain-containing protein/ActR/RegA family two-component response regulator
MSTSLSSNINPAIHARQTALLYRNAGLGQLFTVLAAIPTAYLGCISRPGATIGAWLACMVFLAYYRYRLALRYRAARPSEAEAPRWSARYVRLTALQSILWLVGGGSIMWDNTDSYRFLVVLIMVGMVAGGVPVLSAVKSAFRVYAVPMTIGASVLTFADASAPVHYVLGVVLLIFFAGVTRSSDSFNEVLLESVTTELGKSQLVRKAEAAVRAKSEFLANISHEIRTPMNSILGMAQLAYKAERHPRQRDYLRKIQLSGEHLLSIIDDILDISKIDAGKLSIEVVDFELARVIENLTNLVAEKAEDKRLRLIFDIDPAIPPYLCGDPLRLCQVLINLVNNAIKFTEEGEVTVRIKRLDESENGVLLYFEVRDTGIGMSEDEMAMLFQSFQQTDSSTTRKYGGTGLGLVICKQLVEMMGDGQIGVESRPGKGSTFWFQVRLAEGTEPAPQAGELQWHENGKTESGVLLHGACILLVDDNAFNLQVATDFLLSAGVVVTTGRNGREALDLLRQERFDCVLMDVQMPEMDGIEAVRRIRCDETMRKVPVIAMTANASKEDRESYLAAGMDDVIIKPFKYQTLFTTLARWLPQKEDGEAGEAAAGHDRGDAGSIGSVIDLSVLAELIGDDREKICEFASRFVESIGQEVEAMEEALGRGDMQMLRALGHNSKSPARMVGAMEVAALCQALEDNDGDIERARDIVARLRVLPAQIEKQVATALR